MNKYEQLANDVLDKIGGKENVTYAAHCMTRLRFNLKDESLIDKEVIKKIPGVMGCQFAGGQFQIIVGPGVDKVYKRICEIAGFEMKDDIKENLDNQTKKEFSWKNTGNSILNGIVGCLTPILPILICSGLIKMIAAIIGPNMLHLVSDTSDIYRLLSFVGQAGFYFFPVFVGLSGAKKFGCNPMIALLMGVLLIDPTFVEIVKAGNAFTVYGIPMTLAEYSSTVLPMIMITFVMSYVEKYVKKIVPESVATLFVPLLTVLIMLPIALCLLAPLGSILGVYLGKGLIAFRQITGPFGVAIIGALFILIVATGMHLTLIATAIVSLTTVGYDNTILVGSIPGTFSMIALGLAMIIKSKDQETRNLSISCFVSQALGGVGEPMMFGLIFRFKRLLLVQMIGTFFGALYVGFTNVSLHLLASNNFLVFLAFSSPDKSNIINGIIACVISFVITFALVIVFGYEGKEKVTA